MDPEAHSSAPSKAARSRGEAARTTNSTMAITTKNTLHTVRELTQWALQTKFGATTPSTTSSQSEYVASIKKPSNPTNKQWFRYHAHTKPHFTFSVAMGLAAPLLLLATPLREKYVYANHQPIPNVYPLPTRARDPTLSGFDDE